MEKAQERARVLLVDDKQEVRDMLEAFLSGMDDIEVAASVGSGTEALDQVRKGGIDVMVLDIIMPQIDGLAVLETIRQERLSPRPEIIMLTGIGSDDVVSQAISLGANYFMVKPFDNQTLYRRIRDLSKIAQPQPPAQSMHIGKSIDERVAGMFITIGIPAHIKGYQFLREAVKLVVANPDIINRITKELYPSIAKRFGTSSSKVERAIRHAIEVAWNRGRIDIINQMFGHCVYTPNDKPTNGEFIALIADKITLDMYAS